MTSFSARGATTISSVARGAIFWSASDGRDLLFGGGGYDRLKGDAGPDTSEFEERGCRDWGRAWHPAPFRSHQPAGRA